MSNKIVPNIYRAVIDDVIATIKPEFEDYGIAEEVLASLQAKWEAKVIDSNVAEFEPPPPAPPPAVAQPVQQANPQWPHLMPGHPHYPQAPHMAYVKSEPQDPRYLLSNPTNPYANLKGPSAPTYPLPGPIRPMPFNSPVTNWAQPAPSSTPAPNNGSTSAAQIPQTDGPSEDSDDSDSSPAFAPRSSHPSLPQPRAPQPNISQDEEAINSDLDDSDEEDANEADPSVGDGNIVFCTYDKVARVKNKWKCVLKDGMIHIKGKDYLFQKCTGEFEW